MAFSDKIALGLLWFVAIALYSTVGYSSPGYDDEIYNIKIAQLGLSTALDLLRTEDVHPPGMYLLNILIFSVVGEWELVRAVSGAFAGAAISYWALAQWRKHGRSVGILTWSFLALNPGLLMWCTGLRWQSYFVPLLIVLSIEPAPKSRFKWIRLGAGLSMLLHLSYAAIVVAPALAAIYWKSSEGTRACRIKGLAIAIVVFMATGLWQLTALAASHAANSENQFGGLIATVIGFTTSQLSNQGLFPLSPLGAASICASFLVTTLSVRRKLVACGSPMGIAYLAGFFALMVTGLGAKARNWVLVEHFQEGLAIACATRGKSRLILVCMGVLCASNLWGVVNVACHAETSRNTWNLPVKSALDVIAGLSDNKKDVVVLAHEPVLAWHLARKGYTVYGPNTSPGNGPGVLNLQGRTLALVLSYRGSIPSAKYDKMLMEVAPVINVASERISLGEDGFANVKMLVDPEYPSFAYKIYVVSGYSRDLDVKSWN